MARCLLLGLLEVSARRAPLTFELRHRAEVAEKISKSQRHSVILAANQVFHRTEVGSSRPLSWRVQKGPINRGMPLRHGPGLKLSSAFGAH